MSDSAYSPVVPPGAPSSSEAYTMPGDASLLPSLPNPENHREFMRLEVADGLLKGLFNPEDLGTHYTRKPERTGGNENSGGAYYTHRNH